MENIIQELRQVNDLELKLLKRYKMLKLLELLQLDILEAVAEPITKDVFKN